MKQFKHVDSLNSKAQVRHIKAVNWYCRELSKNKGFDKHWKRVYLVIDRGISVKQEKCQVR